MVETRTTVRAALHEVFPDVRPSVVTRLGETTDGARVDRVLRGRSWREVSVSDIDGVRGALLFLSPSAFRAYLPAYAMAAVFSGRYGQDHAEHIGYSLCVPLREDPDALAYHATRGSTLEAAQRRAIVALLGAVNESLAERPRRYWVESSMRSLVERAAAPPAALRAETAAESEPWRDLARVRDRVRGAFPADNPPASTELVKDPHTYTDPRGAYSLFGGESWEAAPLGKLRYERSAIHVLLPTAYAYYLPAFLHGALDPTDFGAEISDSVTFSLETVIAKRNTDGRDAAIWRALTHTQRRVAGEVLEVLGRRHRDQTVAAVARAWLEQADEP